MDKNPRPKMLTTRIERLLEQKGQKTIHEIYDSLEAGKQTLGSVKVTLARLANSGRIKRVYNGMYGPRGR